MGKDDWFLPALYGFLFGMVLFGDTKTVEKRVEVPVDRMVQVPVMPTGVDNSRDLNGDGVRDIALKYPNGESILYSNKGLDGKINYTLGLEEN